MDTNEKFSGEAKSKMLSISEAADLLEWYSKLSPVQKCTVHPPAGSGAGTGLYAKTFDSLVEEWQCEQALNVKGTHNYKYAY